MKCIYFVPLTPPHTPPPPNGTKCIYTVPLTVPPPLGGGKSITRAIKRVGPENRDNLEINTICKVCKVRLRYIKVVNKHVFKNKLENRITPPPLFTAGLCSDCNDDVTVYSPLLKYYSHV
jgi:hypothetical protein